jgi:predicted transcriptional regulator of viral defense system
MPGRIYNELAEIAVDQHGLVTTADARDAGIDPHRLIEMRRRGTAERVAHGVYRLPLLAPSTHLEQLAEATKWPTSRGVLSHDTALDVHDLCDINPARIHITIPAAYRMNRKEIPPVYVVHRRDLGKRDKTYYEGIPVVTERRAILDGIEGGVRADLLDQAIDTAARRGRVRAPDVEKLRAKLRERARG